MYNKFRIALSETILELYMSNPTYFELVALELWHIFN